MADGEVLVPSLAPGRVTTVPRGHHRDDRRPAQAARWAKLVDEHVGAVWTWALRATGSRTSAEQLSEVAWLRLAQALPSLTDEQVPFFLRRAVRNASPSCDERLLGIPRQGYTPRE